MKVGIRVSRRVRAMALIGLVVIAIPVGIGFVRGLPATTASNDAILTPTLPEGQVINATGTPTPTGSAPGDRPSPTSRPGPGDGLVNTPVSTRGGEDSDGRQTLVVDDDGNLPTADCPGAGYSLIQAAVDDADSGDAVVVCSGTYRESITVGTSNLTISADETVTIVSLGQPAVWANASEFTMEGFEIRSRRHSGPAVTVGGIEPLIRDNTVRSLNGTGMFFSDGLTKRGEPDPQLDAATRARVVNNTVTSFDYRIWSDSDQTVIRNNSITDLKTVTDAERQACVDGREGCESGNSSIISSGNGSVIRNNTVRYTNHPPALWDPNGTAIIVGGGDSQNPIGRGNSFNVPNRSGHNSGHGTVVVDNTVTGAPRAAVDLLRGAAGSVVRNNTFTDNIQGIRVWANRSTVRNNYVSRANYVPFRGVTVAGEAKIVNNTITRYSQGLVVAGRAEIIGNTITDNLYMGVFFEDHNTEYFDTNGTGIVLNNTITRNGRAGVAIDPLNDRSNISIHYNRIQNNGVLGVSSKNPDKTDGFWPIVNATHNTWECGGPSSGGGTTTLEDPYTGREANGTGDAISAGDETGVSNVHFDPYMEPADCPLATATPRPTDTRTPTPTASAEPGYGTPTPTVGKNATAGPPKSQTGGGGGSGSGSGSGEGNGNAGDAITGTSDVPGEEFDSDRTSVPPPKTSSPDPTPPPSPSISPTPMIEPGFGFSIWFIGVAGFVWVLVLRNRSTRSGETSDE